MNDDIIDFYLNDFLVDREFTFKDFLVADTNWLEDTHNYIQWVFPTKTKSRYNPKAPILDRETALYLQDGQRFKKLFNLACRKQLRFWGFGADYTLPIGMPRNVVWWFEHNNHNRLRIARFLESTCLLGEPYLAITVFDELVRKLSSHDPSVPIWRNIVRDHI